MKLLDTINDPSSQQASMSRLCFGLEILSILGLCWLAATKLAVLPTEVVDLIKTTLIATAGLYASNSVAGVISRHGILPTCETQGVTVGMQEPPEELAPVPLPQPTALAVAKKAE